jgi:hypothetical protein
MASLAVPWDGVCSTDSLSSQRSALFGGVVMIAAGGV